MANKDLNIIISAIDKATGPIKKIGKGLNGFAEKNKETFQKMAIGGTAAFGALGIAINKATQTAAADQGTWNKFTTVFADGTDEMNKFVNDLRTRMPVATGTIQRMAADLQDLLVPIGLSRELGAEMTQGFLEVSNAIGAFNDVNPAEVLEAIKSGLTGSSEPLKRFGVDASITALETKALQMGLIEAGGSLKDFTPEVQNQIKAQALLAQVTSQSSDAIGGFETNADSLLFRQMELNAGIEDLSGTLGAIFVPILDDIVKAILPIVTDIANWIKENEELTKKIVLVTGAILGIVTVLGTLGLVIGPIITTIKTLTLVVGVLGKALMFLAANPIGLVITAIALLVTGIYLLYKNWDKVGPIIERFGEKILNVFNNITSFVGDVIKGAYEWGGNLMGMLFDGIMSGYNKVKDGVIKVATTISDFLGFGSPTKEGPNSKSDRWIPNLIDMLSSGLENGQMEIERAASELAERIELGMSNFSIEEIKEALTDIQMTALSASEDIKSSITGQKSKVRELVDEYLNLKEQISQIDLNIGEIKSGGALEIAQRAIELETQLADIQKKIQEEKEADNKKILEEKQKQIEAELQLAQANTTQADIDKIKLENEKSETQKLIEKNQLKIQEAEAEKTRLIELAELKRQEAITEYEQYKSLISQKAELDKAYFSLFGTYIKSTNSGLDSAIQKMRTLNSLRGASSSSSGTEGARALGGPVSANKTYLVGERGPELFTPASSGRINNNPSGGAGNITINMGGIVVNNEADENRLIEKMKRALIRDTQLFNNGIA